MVDEFSSFARMPKPLPESDDLSSTIRQVLFLMRVGNPEIQIVEHLPSQIVTAHFDRRLLSQALTNIIKNATESVAAFAVDSDDTSFIGQIDVSLATSEDRITIDVTDNGIGFPVESRTRLLEPYMTTRSSGTGLGLAIVGKILEDHGGGIELLDRMDQQRGACVRLWFPIETKTETAPSMEHTPS
jgi:two-component system nitrogen regulation sensor histidine kinase NtrY